MLLTDPHLPTLPIFLTPIELEELSRPHDTDIQRELERRRNAVAKREIHRVSFLSKKYAHLAQKSRVEKLQQLSQAERRTAYLLCMLGIQYEHQHIIYTEDSFILADLYLPEYNIVLEINGNTHYTNSEQKAKDLARSRFLRSRGYQCKSITNLQALAMSPSQFIEDILPDINIPTPYYEHNACIDSTGSGDDRQRS